MQKLLLLAIAILMVSTGLSVSCIEDIPYTKALGQPINLINNKQAEDPTWQELKSFLLQDTTDEHLYSPSYSCGNFAEELHNNAEKAGIKAALVAVEFYSGEPHALNAFNTIDRGLVYIDVTSDDTLLNSIPSSVSKLSGDTTSFDAPDTDDKVAYIKVGSELGFISPEYTNGDFSYAFYTLSEEKLPFFKAELAEYNAEVEEYNTWIEGHALYYDYSSGSSNRVPVLNNEDYKVATEWADELAIELAQLEQEWEGLKGFVWEPLGRVRSFNVYW